MKFGLNKKTINLILDFFKTIPEVKKVIIFGSRSTDNFHAGSDIDFEITAPNIKISEFKMKQKLEQLSTPYFFDVKFSHMIKNEILKNEIKINGVIFSNGTI